MHRTSTCVCVSKMDSGAAAKQSWATAIQRESLSSPPPPAPSSPPLHRCSVTSVQQGHLCGHSFSLPLMSALSKWPPLSSAYRLSIKGCVCSISTITLHISSWSHHRDIFIRVTMITTITNKTNSSCPHCHIVAPLSPLLPSSSPPQ